MAGRRRAWRRLLPAGAVLLASLSAVTATQVVTAPPAAAEIEFDCESPEGIAYFVNTNSGSVSLIYTGTDTNIRNIPVGGVPYGVGATPDGSKVYVAGGAGGVAVINTDTFAVSAVPAAPGAPWATPVGAWPSTDGTKMFVSNIFSPRVTVIDTATDTGTSSIALPGAGGAGWMDAVGDRLFVAREAGTGGGIAEIDMVSGTLARSVSYPAGAHELAVNETFLVHAIQDATIVVRGTNAPSAVQRTIATPAAAGSIHGLAFAPDTNYLIATTNGNGTTTPGHTLVYDATTGALLRDFTASRPNARIPVTSPLSDEVFIAAGPASVANGAMDRMVTTGDPSTWTYTQNQTALQAFPDGHTPAFSCLRALGGTKALADATIRVGQSTRLTVTLENYNIVPTQGLLNAAFTDDLPTGLEVAATPNAATTCASGTVTAAGGSQQVSLAGGTVPPAALQGNTKVPGRCTVGVDVTAVGPAGDLTNTIPEGGITADGVGSSTEAVSNDFTIYAEPTVSARKNFPDGRAEDGDQFTTTITNGATTVATGTTTGAETGIQDQDPGEVAGPATGTEGVTYTATETPVGATDPLDYVASYDCVDARNGDAPVASGQGTSVTFDVPATDADVDYRCTFTNEIAVPELELTKTASAVDDVDGNGPDAGDIITYSFAVENTGNVALDPVELDDPLLGGALPCGTGPLPVGETRDCPGATYTLSQEDVDAGTVENTATATGTAPNGDQGTDIGDTATAVAADPDLTIDKTAADPVDANGNGRIDTGDTIAYTFVVTNTGTVTLTGVGVDDPLAGPVTCDVTTLAPGDTTDCEADDPYVVTQDDVDGGSVDNTATASGTPPAGPEVTSDPDTTATPLDGASSLELVKSASPAVAEAGEVITYGFEVTNTGATTLTSVTVTDPDLGAVTCPPASVAPGDSVTCTTPFTRTVTQAEVDAGTTLTNTATAAATDPDGGPVGDDDTATVEMAPAAPALELTKLGDLSDQDGDNELDLGETVQYSFLVENTGNVTIDDVAVIDPMVGAVTCPASTLAPGASTTCTADAVYAVTQADVDAGQITNTATATGVPARGVLAASTDTVEVPADAAPAIALEKTATVDPAEHQDAVQVGDTITYGFTVTNTGNTTLSGVAVDDPALGAVTCDAVTLNPGVATACDADEAHTVTQADVDSGGPVANTATVSGSSPGGVAVDDEDTVEVPVVAAAPGLEFVKEGELEVDDGLDAGDTVVYTFTVTNTGNVTVTDIEVDDPMLDRADVEVECESTALAPDEETTCTADYAVTAAEADDGEVRNVATATGESPGDLPVVSEESANVIDSDSDNGGDDTSDDGGLPDTGGPALALGLVGLLALLAGGILLLRSRRHRMG